MKNDDLDKLLEESVDLLGSKPEPEQPNIVEKTLEQANAEVAAKDMLSVSIGNMFGALSLMIAPIVALFVSKNSASGDNK